MGPHQADNSELAGGTALATETPKKATVMSTGAAWPFPRSEMGIGDRAGSLQILRDVELNKHCIHNMFTHIYIYVDIPCHFA